MQKHKKRSKRTRLRGRRTCGWGARKKHKYSGHRGGCGMAGTGKKSGQRLTFIQRYFPGYLGRKAPVSQQIRLQTINVEDIEKNLSGFEKDKRAKKTAKGIELNLEGYKILGNGDVKEKLFINATTASEGAKEKVKKAGGEIVVKEFIKKAPVVAKEMVKKGVLSQKEPKEVELKKEEKVEKKEKKADKK